MNPKLTIALLSGGTSSERQVSLAGGDQVYAALNKDKYTVRRYDPKTDLAKLVADAPGIDAALVILHGPAGEDGTVQGLLELLKIPYQGAGVLGSALAMNKLAAKRLYEKAGIPVPAYQTIQKEEASRAAEAMAKTGLPLVVKPVTGGSSIGMTIVRSAADFPAALARAFDQDRTALVEAYIPGTELTVAVLGNPPEALPVIEIVPSQSHEFFDYHAKYTPGATEEICPARIAPLVEQKAKTYALMAHQTLFGRGYSRTDMILGPDQNLYVLETNTIPGMTATSLLPLAARTAGMAYDQLLDRLIALCLAEYRTS